MKEVFATAVLFVVSACAPLTEQQKEARHYRQVDWENRYLAYAGKCRRAGGRMIIESTRRIGKNGIPHRGDLFDCTAYVGKTPRP